MTRIYAPMQADIYAKLFQPAEQERLAALGDLTTEEVASTEELAARIAGLGGVDVLVTAWSTPPVPVAACLSGGVKMIAHAAGSIKRLVPKELVAKGVVLSQSAAAIATAVAEMSVTLCLVLLRQVHAYDRMLQSSRDWRSARNLDVGRSLAARRIGVVGAGRTGVGYIQLVRGLGATDIACYDPYLLAERAAQLGVRLVDLDELFSSCDVVAVHAPTTPETHHLIGAKQLALLADDAIIVNTARSWVMDYDALLAELRGGRLRAALDVFDEEPLPPDSPFYTLPNVIVTPHQAGATVEAQHLQGLTAVDEVERFLRGEPLQQAVTVENYDRLA